MTGTACAPAAMAGAARCEECGFDGAGLEPAAIPAALRAFAKRYRAPLSRFLPGEDGDAVVRRRPAPQAWSALEHASHVRDVFGGYQRWISQCLAEDRPALEGPSPDELAAEGRYNDGDPAAVAEAVAAGAEGLAATVEGVPEGGWHRAGVRHGQEPTVLVMACRAVHEGNHHLLDIGRGMRAVRDEMRAAT